MSHAGSAYRRFVIRVQGRQVFQEQRPKSTADLSVTASRLRQHRASWLQNEHHPSDEDICMGHRCGRSREASLVSGSANAHLASSSHARPQVAPRSARCWVSRCRLVPAASCMTTQLEKKLKLTAHSKIGLARPHQQTKDKQTRKICFSFFRWQQEPGFQSESQMS